MKLAITLLMLAGLLCAQQPARDLRIEPKAFADALQDGGSRWAVVIGISSYKYLPPGVQLRFAHRDAQDFAEFLRSTSGGAVPSDHIRLLTNEQATLAGIRAALHTWLPRAAGPRDIVYFFFAGHGVLDEQNEGYFVAHDSDPQNLHATALSFQETDRTLSYGVGARLVVLVADACHTGRLGWSTYTAAIPNQAAGQLERMGQGDRSFLKLLAASPSERSFEDERWNGGHGAFTNFLLQGLRGDANHEGDRLIRASKAIDYVSRLVPEQTGNRQHPRIAGTFDAGVPLAIAPLSSSTAFGAVALDLAGPASSAVYVDNVFRGRIRSTGALRVESLIPGPHSLSVDFPDGATLDRALTLGTASVRVTVAASPASLVQQLRSLVQANQLLEPNGAWDYYRSHSFSPNERADADALISGALEEAGQACVGDYVQSTSIGLKHDMLQRAVDAYQRLQTLRPRDAGIEVRGLFCKGRLQIAENRFPEAIATLENVLKHDPHFACAYNAMGVALLRVHRKKEARAAFERAAELTPEWALPPFQIASQLVAEGDLANARPYLAKAVQLSPGSVGTRWTELHVNRLLGHNRDAVAEAAELIRLNPNYAPTYVELGLAYEAGGEFTKAREAFDKYVLLAPNFADTNAVRAHAEKMRAGPSR